MYGYLLRTTMTPQLPSDWHRTESSVHHCYTNGTYRIYLFTIYKDKVITGAGIKKGDKWIIPRTFFLNRIDATPQDIEKMISNLLKQITLYEV